MISNRQLFIIHLLSFSGIPYIWGGQSREGLDCSGLVGVAGSEYGLWGKDEDHTAEGWFRKLEQIPEDQVLPGDLIFYKNNNGKIIHTEFVLGHGKVFGAIGGNSKCKSIGKAKAYNANCRIDKIGRGRQIAGFCRIPISEM